MRVQWTREYEDMWEWGMRILEFQNREWGMGKWGYEQETEKAAHRPGQPLQSSSYSTPPQSPPVPLSPPTPSLRRSGDKERSEVAVQCSGELGRIPRQQCVHVPFRPVSVSDSHTEVALVQSNHCPVVDGPHL